VSFSATSLSKSANIEREMWADFEEKCSGPCTSSNVSDGSRMDKAEQGVGNRR
jgi:hypothetical protein